MDIWIYSPYEHERTALLDSFDGMTITRNDEAPDDIEISTQVTGSAAAIAVDSILWPVGDTTAFLVTSIDLEERENSTVRARIRGKSMEVLLSMRFLDVPKTYTGTPAQVCTRMCADVFRAAGRSFPGLICDFSAATGEAITLDADGSLLENVQAALSGGLYGLRSTFEPTTCAITVSAHAGQTRSIVFDEKYDTFSEAGYTDDISDHADMCYVYDDEGGTAVVGTTTLTGFRRREGAAWHTGGRESFDADGNTIELSDAQYQTAMKNTGAGYMSGHRRAQELSGSVNLHSRLMQYGVDFGLGDVCTVRKAAWGVSLQRRLNRVIETYENGTQTLRAEFGTAALTLSDKIRRGETE